MAKHIWDFLQSPEIKSEKAVTRKKKEKRTKTKTNKQNKTLDTQIKIF